MWVCCIGGAHYTTKYGTCLECLCVGMGACVCVYVYRLVHVHTLMCSSCYVYRHLIWLHCTLLLFTDSAVFTNWSLWEPWAQQVCQCPFPTAFAHFVSLSHSGSSLYFNSFLIIFVMIWDPWSLVLLRSLPRGTKTVATWDGALRP